LKLFQSLKNARHSIISIEYYERVFIVPIENCLSAYHKGRAKIPSLDLTVYSFQNNTVFLARIETKNDAAVSGFYCWQENKGLARVDMAKWCRVKIGDFNAWRIHLYHDNREVIVNGAHEITFDARQKLYREFLALTNNGKAKDTPTINFDNLLDIIATPAKPKITPGYLGSAARLPTAER
jgi:hypothetical protein